METFADFATKVQKAGSQDERWGLFHKEANTDEKKEFVLTRILNDATTDKEYLMIKRFAPRDGNVDRNVDYILSITQDPGILAPQV